MPSRLLVAFAASVLLVSCGEGPAGPREIQGLPRDLTAQEQLVVDAANDFTFRLFGRIAADEPGANVFVSPLSVSMALGMTMNGADGATLEAMREVLGFGTLTLDEIGQSYRDLIDLILGLDPTVTTMIANAIWYREGFTIEPDFVETNREFFDAEVEALDFTSPAALSTINGWASEKTRGRIPSMLDRIDPAWVLILMNALYFKGAWTEAFDPERTREATFHLADGSTRRVPMMFHDEKFPGYIDEEKGVVELPYGGGAFTMVVVVPREVDGLDDLVAGLDAAAWEELVGRIEGDGEVEVRLPRLELEYERNLVDDLAAMGMGVAFTPAADFGRLSSDPFWIDIVKQKTFVKVDEEGTEAAAVTIVAGPTSLPPTVIADRPYLFAIRERFSGTILFVGQVVDPTR
ncbi:MAG: serpin family protein [Gemmatimonadetes bacterium]|nr:serpin family protein [Gemmatimonadota bacterium]